MARKRGRHSQRVGVRRELTFFYGIALVALIAVSIGALAASRTVARSEALKDAERITSRLANILVGPILDDALRGDPRALQELDRTIANRMADGYLTEVTIWDGDGRVVYANVASEIGQQFEPPVEVTAAIRDGAISSAFEDQPEASDLPFNPDGPGFVEVYVPFGALGESRYAFEAYYDYARVDDAADSLLWQLVPLVLIPLLLLQLIQSPIPVSLARRVRGHEEERSTLLERTLAVSDKERARVAADLHDGPIQDLAGVTYALDAVSLTVKAEHRPLMRDVQDTVTHAVRSLRKLMIDLYPPDLSADQLPATISNLAGPLRDRDIDVQIDMGQLPDLDSDTVTTLYRVAREAIVNIVEHAAASHVRISLQVTAADRAAGPSKGGALSGGQVGGGIVSNRTVSGGISGADGARVQLIVADDGVGLDTNRLNRREEGHLGLRLLIDRVKDLGGEFTLSSEPAGGTTVCVALPMTGQPIPA